MKKLILTAGVCLLVGGCANLQTTDRETKIPARAGMKLVKDSAGKETAIAINPAAPENAVSCEADTTYKLCKKAIWSLNSDGAAVIAELEEPATYRICVERGSKGAVRISIDHAIILALGTAPSIYPPTTMDEVFKQPCALVTGKTIHLLAEDTLSNPQMALGTYQRIEKNQPFTGLFEFNYAIKANKDQSVMLAENGAISKLHRICFGPVIPPRSIGTGKYYIYTEKGFLYARKPPQRGFNFSDSTCFDIQARQVFLFSTPLPMTDANMSGYFAY